MIQLITVAVKNLVVGKRIGLVSFCFHLRLEQRFLLVSFRLVSFRLVRLRLVRLRFVGFRFVGVHYGNR